MQSYTSFEQARSNFHSIQVPQHKYISSKKPTGT
jgi:hypothetical protein